MIDREEIKRVFMEMEPRSAMLRLAYVEPALNRFGIIVFQTFRIEWPPPHYYWIKQMRMLVTRPGVRRAAVYAETLFEPFKEDGMPCELFFMQGYKSEHPHEPSWTTQVYL